MLHTTWNLGNVLQRTSNRIPPGGRRGTGLLLPAGAAVKTQVPLRYLPVCLLSALPLLINPDLFARELTLWTHSSSVV